MPIRQILEQTQKLALTQSMQQSLQILQMPVLEVREYLQEVSLSNPVLELNEARQESPLPEVVEKSPEEPDELGPSDRWKQIWSGGESEESPDFTAFAVRPVLFSEYLREQIGQMPALSEEMRSLCGYLIDCLTPAGYLDCPLADLAKELNSSDFELEQALYVVQSLDPPGVGARNLAECLLLQLAQGHEFTQINLRLIRDGLPLLAERNLEKLSQVLHASRKETERAAQVIQSLNPIPSNGFCTDSVIHYAVPEAAIRLENGQAVVEINERLLPAVTLSPEYCAMLGDPSVPEAKPYLKEKYAEAKSLIAGLQGRESTMTRLLTAVARRQMEYLKTGESLQPMTMRDLAEELSLSVSTVSRAVKDKYILFGGHTIPLKRLFTTSLTSNDGEAVSAASAKQNLKRFIEAENPREPLSDNALREALEGLGIQLSRRAVAKYRTELKIPSAKFRQKI